MTSVFSVIVNKISTSYFSFFFNEMRSSLYSYMYKDLNKLVFIQNKSVLFLKCYLY